MKRKILAHANHQAQSLAALPAAHLEQAKATRNRERFSFQKNRAAAIIDP